MKILNTVLILFNIVLISIAYTDQELSSEDILAKGYLRDGWCIEGTGTRYFSSFNGKDITGDDKALFDANTEAIGNGCILPISGNDRIDVFRNGFQKYVDWPNRVSWSAWVYRDFTSGTRLLFQSVKNSSNNGSFSFNGSSWTFRTKIGNNLDQPTFADGPANQEWSFVVVNWDGYAGLFEVFVNCESKYQHVEVKTATVTDGANFYWFTQDNKNYWIGRAMDIRIHSRPLTISRQTELYLEGLDLLKAKGEL